MTGILKLLKPLYSVIAFEYLEPSEYCYPQLRKCISLVAHKIYSEINAVNTDRAGGPGRAAFIPPAESS